MSRSICPTHPDVDYKTAWGCPECVAQLRDELARVREKNARMDEALKVAMEVLDESIKFGFHWQRAQHAIAVIDEARREKE